MVADGKGDTEMDTNMEAIIIQKQIRYRRPRGGILLPGAPHVYFGPTSAPLYWCMVPFPNTMNLELVSAQTAQIASACKKTMAVRSSKVVGVYLQRRRKVPHIHSVERNRRAEASPPPHPLFFQSLWTLSVESE